MMLDLTTLSYVVLEVVAQPMYVPHI